MTRNSQYLRNFLRWRPGRQDTGYEKMLLLANPFLLPFDCYLLRYKQGSGIPEHIDPVDEKRHYRLNVVLRQAEEGGDFVCDEPIYASSRVMLFRPDRSRHLVTTVQRGVRYVLSIGWVRRRNE